MKPGHPHKNKIFALSLIKFPVLYLAGFFILKSNFFSVISIVIGLTAVMFLVCVTWLRFNIKKALVGVFILGVLFSGAKFAYAAEHAAAAHGEAKHEEEHEEGEHHGVNLVNLIAGSIGNKEISHKILEYENMIWGALVIFVLAFVFYLAAKKSAIIPGRLQTACEAIVEGLYAFVAGILGPANARKYAPFLGTLFLYIWIMNLIGLIPLMKSNTPNYTTLPGSIPMPVPTTTLALALIVFVFVQAVAIKNQGIVGYLDHMAGTPRDVFGWVMVPIMLPIHLIGEISKPLSLSLRLFCNTLSGHILVGVFIAMAIGTYFIPFQSPFLIFEILTGTIQAFVFMLLSTVYIALMLPHEHDHHEEGHAHGAPAH